MKKIYLYLKQEISEKCYFKSTFKPKQAKIVTLNGKSKKVVTLDHLAKYQMSSGPHGPIFLLRYVCKLSKTFSWSPPYQNPGSATVSCMKTQNSFGINTDLGTCTTITIESEKHLKRKNFFFRTGNEDHFRCTKRTSSLCRHNPPNQISYYRSTRWQICGQWTNLLYAQKGKVEMTQKGEHQKDKWSRQQ